MLTKARSSPGESPCISLPNFCIRPIHFPSSRSYPIPVCFSVPFYWFSVFTPLRYFILSIPRQSILISCTALRAHPSVLRAYLIIVTLCSPVLGTHTVTCTPYSIFGHHRTSCSLRCVLTTTTEGGSCRGFCELFFRTGFCPVVIYPTPPPMMLQPPDGSCISAPPSVL